MQILLLEKIHNLGNLGDEVKVKPGFARNFLIPQGKAVPATPEHREQFEARRADLEKQQADVLAVAQRRASELDGLNVTLMRKAGDEGKLFGSVGASDIADAVSAMGVEAQRTEVRMTDNNLRQTGEYEVGFQVHPDVTASITLKIEAEV